MTHDELLAKIDGNFPNEGTHLDQAIAIGNLYRQGLSALRAVVELHKPILETPLPPEPKWDGYQDYDWANSGGIELTHAKALHTLAEQTIQAIEKELK